MFDRPEGGSRALLVELDLGDGRVDDRLHELAALAVSAGAEVVGRITGKRQRPDPATFAGKGKVEEIGARQNRHRGRTRDLRPPVVRRAAAQPRAGARLPRRRPHQPDSRHLRPARTQQRSKLQVELAQLKHMATRLVGGWTHSNARRRHRAARSRRDAARNRPAPDRQAGQGPHTRLSGVARSRATQGRTRGAPPCARSRSWAIPTRASRRCSTA